MRVTTPRRMACWIAPRICGGPRLIRAEDTEPYVGLQYGALLRSLAMIVIVAIIAEVVAGLMYEGVGVGFNLFAEVIQAALWAAMLWARGRLTLLFIDVATTARRGGCWAHFPRA